MTESESGGVDADLGVWSETRRMEKGPTDLYGDLDGWCWGIHVYIENP